MIRFIIFLLFIGCVYSECKPKWLEEKLTETCSYSLKNDTDLEMSKTMNESCSIYKLINLTDTAEQKTIMNCLLDDQSNSFDNLCEKWWIEQYNTTNEILSEKELGLYQFVKLVKKVINQSENCLYGLSDKNSETCQFLAKNDTTMSSFERIIYQKLIQKDLLDQQVVEHCFLYHQFDEFHKCVGVSNGTHIDGFTMSKARQTRIQFLWKAYQDNMFRCIKHFDSRNCIEKFDIRNVCKDSGTEDCIQVMMCKYSSFWKTMPDHICYFITQTKKFIPKTVCDKENKSCVQAILCSYTNSLQITQGHICQINSKDDEYVSPRIVMMQSYFNELEKINMIEDCYNFHQNIDEEICKKVENTNLLVTDICFYEQKNSLNTNLQGIKINSCPMSNLIKTTNQLERQLILSCLIDDEYINSGHICEKWWNEVPNLTKDNLLKKEIYYYQFATVVKGIIKQAEHCLFGLVDKASNHCQSFNNYKKILKRVIYEKLFLRDIEDQKFVNYCYEHRPIPFTNNKIDKRCIGIANGKHLSGFTMSNERQTRFSFLWKKIKNNNENYTDILQAYGMEPIERLG